MQFASFTFLFLFFPLTLAAYYLTPGRWKNITFLATNILFILGGGVLSATVLFLMTIGTYGAGILIEHVSARRKLSGLVTALVAIMEFSVLILLRSVSLQNLTTGWMRGVDLFPLGLSFFVLQSLDYCFEVQRGRCPAQRHVFELARYLLFYPRLIMGPVVPYRAAIKQVPATRCHASLIGGGMFRFLIGLAKKLLLADWVNMFYLIIVQADEPAYSVMILWLGALAKLLALFLELSGYADMAIGLAQCYGIRFPESYGKTIFYPTISQFADQWNRTVVQWFFHYVGTRFHGSRKLFHVFAVMVTWGCIGLWYDLRLTTLVWGMGIGLCIGIEYLMGYGIRYPVLRYILTFVLLCVGAVLLAQPDAQQAFAYVRGMLGGVPITPTDADGRLLRSYLLVILISVYAACGNWQTLTRFLDQNSRLSFLRQPLTLLAALALFVLDAVLLVSFDGTVSFQLTL